MTVRVSPSLGISTGALHDPYNWSALLPFSPDIVEFYNYPSSAIDSIGEFCSTAGVIPSLHVPVPYDATTPLRRFCPTGPDEDEARAARELTLGTIRSAALLRANHVVVHFPTPYPDAGQAVTSEIVDRFFGPVVNFAEAKGISVAVENLTSHPTFYHPEHYSALLESYPPLNLCLDFGHAELLRFSGGIEAFAREIGPRITVCHVYDIASGSDGLKERRLPTPDSSCFRSFDVAQSIDIVLKVGAKPVFILEPDSLICSSEAKVSCAAWLRSLFHA